MYRIERKHIIDALATYICVMAKRKGIFIHEIDIEEIGKALDATHTEQEKAHLRAREILRDFI